MTAEAAFISTPSLAVYADYAWSERQLPPEYTQQCAAVTEGMTENEIRDALASPDDEFPPLELVPTSSEVIRTYTPSEDHPLFLDLANCKITLPAILDFAKLNGSLSSGQPVFGGDPFFEWAYSILFFRRFIPLVGFIQKKDEGKIEEMVAWKPGDRIVRVIWDDGWGPLGIGKTFDASANGFDFPTSIEAAKAVVSAAVSLRLKNSPAVLDSSLRLSIAGARSLLPLAYLQFAKAISDRRSFVSCESCRRFFEVSGGASRSDREFCSDACRMRVYRQRIKDAQKMRGEGKTLREIAASLGSSVETVKGWVANIKKGKA